jgi:hypothetical protein
MGVAGHTAKVTLVNTETTVAFSFERCHMNFPAHPEVQVCESNQWKGLPRAKDRHTVHIYGYTAIASSCLCRQHHQQFAITAITITAITITAITAITITTITTGTISIEIDIHGIGIITSSSYTTTRPNRSTTDQQQDPIDPPPTNHNEHQPSPPHSHDCPRGCQSHPTKLPMPGLRQMPRQLSW